MVISAYKDFYSTFLHNNNHIDMTKLTSSPKVEVVLWSSGVEWSGVECCNVDVGHPVITGSPSSPGHQRQIMITLHLGTHQLSSLYFTLTRRTRLQFSELFSQIQYCNDQSGDRERFKSQHCLFFWNLWEFCKYTSVITSQILKRFWAASLSAVISNKNI